MKDQRDPGTIDMTLSERRKPGPKPTGKAKSAAERMREYRARTVPVRRVMLEAAVTSGLQAENESLRARVAYLERQLRNVTKTGKGG